jgi:hypothetical protein
MGLIVARPACRLGHHSAAGRFIPLRKVVVRVRRGVADLGRALHKHLQAAHRGKRIASTGAARKGLWITGDNTRSPTARRVRLTCFPGAFRAPSAFGNPWP